MDWLTLLLFVPACFALNMAPGPNNLLAMSHGQRFGFVPAMVAGFGRLLAFCVMISLAATGLAAILYASETLFLTIKVAGACYLFWVAFKLWGAEIGNSSQHQTKELSLLNMAYREFMLAAGNPKAILIFTAFLPQFVDVTSDTTQQFMWLGMAFLLLELVAIAFYVAAGVYLSQWFAKPEMRTLFNRTCATLIGAMGIGLLLDRKA